MAQGHLRKLEETIVQQNGEESVVDQTKVNFKVDDATIESNSTGTTGLNIAIPVKDEIQTFDFNETNSIVSDDRPAVESEGTVQQDTGVSDKTEQQMESVIKEEENEVNEAQTTAQ